MTIAARNVAVFKPSKELSGRLNGGSEDEPGTLQPTQSLNPSKVLRKYTATSSTPRGTRRWAVARRWSNYTLVVYAPCPP